MCTSIKEQTLFEFFLQFFKSLERTLSSSFELSQCLKVKAGALHKKKSCILLAFGIPRRALFTTEKKRKNNSAAQARPREARSLLASATTLQREATVPHSSLEHLVSNTCVSDSLNLSSKRPKQCHSRKKETISSQLAPLKMLDLNAKQQRAVKKNTRHNITSKHGTHIFSLNVGLF